MGWPAFLGCSSCSIGMPGMGEWVPMQYSRSLTVTELVSWAIASGRSLMARSAFSLGVVNLPIDCRLCMQDLR